MSTLTCARYGNNHFLLRNILQALFAAILCLVAGSKTAQAARPLRIVTFNAQCLAAPETRASRIPRFRFDQARVEHLERVASLIETLEPDILNLAEVTSVEAVNQLVGILHEKGLEKYRGYHIESHDSFTGFDVALIARIQPDLIEGVPIRCIYSPKGDPAWRETFTYQDEEGIARQREASISRNAIYYFTVGNHRLGFLGLHLKSNPSDAYSNARRTAESLIAQRVIRKEILSRGYLPIVLGDLNDYDPDVPDRDNTRSTATQVLANLKQYDPALERSELVNTAERIVRVADRYTSHWDRNENGVADSDDVYTMLDYILLPRQLMPHVRRAFISRCSNLRTSDHWAVVVDISLPD